jgi:hypothetical protein
MTMPLLLPYVVSNRACCRGCIRGIGRDLQALVTIVMP